MRGIDRTPALREKGAQTRTSTASPDQLVAISAYKGWSPFGAPWLQPVAFSRKFDGLENRRNMQKPLPWAATCSRDERMVRRGVSGSSPEEGLKRRNPRKSRFLLPVRASRSTSARSSGPVQSSSRDGQVPAKSSYCAARQSTSLVPRARQCGRGVKHGKPLERRTFAITLTDPLNLGDRSC